MSGDGGPAALDRRASAAVGEAVWTRVQRLTGELRAHGADVALSELLDAAEALRHVDVGDRSELKAGLRCVLVKHAHHEAAFDAAFDRCFPARWSRPPAHEHGGPAERQPDPAAATADATALDHRLRAAVDAGSDAELRVLAEDAVERYGGFDGAVRTERYHVYRVLRALDLARLLQDAVRRARAGGDEISREELTARVEALRRLITEQVRARLPGAAPAAAEGMLATALDVEIARASAAQLDEVRAAVRPLVRRLAARLRHRRQSVRTGRVDMRRTARRSVGTGGVPLDVVYRRPRAHKPELFTLCDLSGSVADFAGFTLTLVSALAGELSGTRSFAFVDAIDEITDLVTGTTHPIEPWQVLQHGRVIGPDGHSDYGAVLTAFWERYGRTGLTHRSTVLVTGDARTNYRPEAADVLAAIAHRARAVYWLNPEPRAQWGTTDSALAAYARHCDRVFEVRTLRHLVDAVESIL
ncbi:MAG TPA: VWA domain-containing protein [Acidimicrobiales bacterium]